MNSINEFKKRVSYIWQMLKLMFELDHAFFAYIIIDIIIMAIVPFVSMYLTKYAIDILTDGTDYNLFVKTVVGILIAYTVLKVLGSVTTEISVLKSKFIGDKITTKIFNKCEELDYESLYDKQLLEDRQFVLNSIKSGQFASLITSIRQILTNTITLFGTIYIIVDVEALIFVFIGISLILNIIATKYRAKHQFKLSKELSDSERKWDYFANINFDNQYAKDIRLYDYKDIINSDFKEMEVEARKFNSKAYIFMFISYSVSIITEYAINIAVYLMLGYKVLVEKTLTVGEFSLYLGAIVTFNQCLQNIAKDYIEIGKTGEYLEHYFKFINIESKNAKNSETVDISNGLKIQFKNVSFKYPKQDNYVLKNINFELNKGEKLAIVGENGAGKTTIVKLLTRFFEPTEGEILLNGENINNIDYDTYIENISTVFQDYKMFAFTIKDNVCSNNDNYDEQKMKEVLQEVGMEEKINSLENGINTYMYKVYDENGVELSGGQSQKLAMARALYKDTPIMIMDEPTSALDPKAEYEIFNTLMQIAKDKTSILISHRLSSTKKCDKILVMKNGCIDDVGTHDELIENDGLYKELYEMQAQFYVN